VCRLGHRSGRPGAAFLDRRRRLSPNGELIPETAQPPAMARLRIRRLARAFARARSFPGACVALRCRRTGCSDDLRAGGTGALRRICVG
jgi:hypothetical protein